MNAIYKRRSIRKFTGESIPREKILEFVKAGMNAPSAGNQQAWVFIVIDDKILLTEIPKVHPYAAMMKDATAGILVCGNLNEESHKGYWMIDGSAATENILLEIADQDYGGVWLGVYPREERMNGLKKLLNLPDHIMPLSLIAVGVPADVKEPKNIFDEKKLKFNKWE